MKSMKISDPYEHSIRAMKEGFYVEALQVLNEWFKLKLSEMLILSRHGNLKGSRLKYLETSQELTLYQLAKILLVLGKLDNKLYSDILKFNSYRNNLVHKLFYMPNYDYPKAINIKDIKEIHKTGLSIFNKLEAKLVKLAMR